MICKFNDNNSRKTFYISVLTSAYDKITGVTLGVFIFDVIIVLTTCIKQK